MPLILVRHAVAESRRGWDEPDLIRPLNERGRKQADALVDQLASYPVSRVLSSPYLRCTQTVAPLATAAAVAVEESDALAEGMSRDAVELVRALAGSTAALCSHGDVIPRVLQTLVIEDELDLGPDPRWQKGSSWVLDSDGGRFTSARYLRPPA